MKKKIKQKEAGILFWELRTMPAIEIYCLQSAFAAANLQSWFNNRLPRKSASLWVLACTEEDFSLFNFWPSADYCLYIKL